MALSMSARKFELDLVKIINDGEGMKPPLKWKCKACNGKGTNPHSVVDGKGNLTGEKGKSICVVCGGRKYIVESA